MAGLGVRFRPKTGMAVERAATPPSGNAEEAIWHQAYDTQTYVAAGQTRLTFFAAVSNDRTLSNMKAAGMFARPEKLQVYQITCDILSVIAVTTAAGGIDGVLNDLALILIGSTGRATWTLDISSKQYGPYSLSALHGTGGPVGFGWGTFTAEESIQFAKNDPCEGWNYHGQIIIPEQVPFSLLTEWAAVQAVSADKRIRMSLWGVLNRRVS